MKQQQPEFKNLKVSLLQLSDKNPRKYINEDHLAELSQSILEKGVLQPIIVRPVGKKYEIVAGERRFRASKMAGLSEIPAIVRELSDDEAFDLMITENLQREDIRPMDEAEAFGELLKRKQDFTSLALRFGKSEVHIRMRVKLLDLIPEFKELLSADIIPIAIAQEIARQQDYIQQYFWENEFAEYQQKHWHCPTLKYLKGRIYNTSNPLLAEAKFDISDKKLKNDAGACTQCTFNTACDASLFPEERKENARCTNPRCFEQKTNLYFERTMKQIIEGNDGVLIGANLQGYMSSDEKKRIAIAEKLGANIIDIKMFRRIYEPDKPEEPERADYNFEDLESAAEYEEALEEFKSDMEEYERELREYQEEISAPDIIKIYDLGDNNGFQYFKERSSNNNADTSGESNMKSILELKHKQKRAAEITIDNINKDISDLFRKQFSLPDDRSVLITEHGYIPAVQKAISVLLLNYSGFDFQKIARKHKVKFASEYEISKKHGHELIEKMDVDDWNEVLKSLIKTQLFSSTPNWYPAQFNAFCNVAESLFPDSYAEIKKRHEEKRDKKIERIESDIKALKKAQKQPAKEPEPVE